MSAQQDTSTAHGKGQFPRAYYSGRQQRYYDGYDGINWGRSKCTCTVFQYDIGCPVKQHHKVAKQALKRAEEEISTNTRTNPKTKTTKNP